MMRKKRRVRLHMVNQAPSVEGIWVNRAAGHYVLAAATLLEREDASHELEGELWVPRERVLYVQVVG